MIGDIMTWLSGDGEGSSARPRGAAELQVAAAALLVEAAHVDDRFDASERAVIRRLLERRFKLSQAEAQQLLASAEATAERSAQLFGFTRVVNDRLSLGERIGLIEMMWEVVLADGDLDPLEDTLLRRVGGLINVPDRDRGAARQRVLQRLGRPADS